MNSRLLVLALGLFFSLLIVGCTYFAPQPVSQPTPSPSPILTPSPEPTAELKCVLDPCKCECVKQGTESEQCGVDCEKKYGLTNESCEAVEGKCQFKEGYSKTPLKKEPKTPFKLVYESVQDTPEGKQKNLFTYYFDEFQECNGKKAILGVFKSEQEGREHASYAKFTVFLENGEIARSDFLDKSKLAFDTAEPYNQTMELAFIMNTVFSAVGENFNEHQIWEKDIPTILKDVQVFGGSPEDLSIKKKGSSSEFLVPCTVFELLVSEVPDSIEICVASKESEILLPYVVKFGSGDMQGMSWELVEAKEEKTPLTYYPQCLEPVECPKVKEPTMKERNQCQAEGGEMISIRDEKNCLTEWKCFTERERAIQEITRWGPSECYPEEPKEEMIQAVLDCWEQEKTPNFIQGENGCVTRVTCTNP